MSFDFSINSIRTIITEVKQDTLPYLQDLDEYFLYSKINGFMNNHELTKSEEFLIKINSEKFFVDWFINSLSFNETELFRDISVWEKIFNNIIPELKENKILLPISNTGLELYSLLILLKQKELLEKCSIYVKCITNKDVHRIKQGIIANKMMIISEKNFEDDELRVNLKNFFISGKNDYKLNFDFEQQCVFFTGELTPDENQNKFDLVIARNKLLYSNEDLHRRFISEIDSLVMPGGFLVLGTLERMLNSDISGNYDLLFSNEKIFRKRVEYR